jgi:RecA-family ATPase
MTPLNVALKYINRGWNPVPIPHGTKAPQQAGWHTRLIDAASAPQYFNGSEMNVGVMLGPNSHGLTDIDLDCAEAIAIAPYLLPPTRAIFGRPSKRASHWLYYTNLALTSEAAALQYRDPQSKAMLLELRMGGDRGAHTVFPGSTHESGEPITWDEDGEPASADADDLRRRVRALAACALIARRWPTQGARHDAARMLGGFLSRAGKAAIEIRYLAEAIAKAAGDPEWRDRCTAAEDAATAHHAGKRAYGLNTMRDMFGVEVAEKAAEWLDYQGGGEPVQVADDIGKQLPPLKWLDMSAWDNVPVPERKWAIFDRVPLNQAGLFSGEGGAGKSIVELTKNVAHVAGKDWLGSLPAQGPAIYIGTEDEEDELHRRLAAIVNYYDVSFRQLIDDGLHVLCLLGQDATLCAAGKSGRVEVTGLYRHLYEMAGDLKPKNVSIDTLSRAFVGNEIDRTQVYGFAMHMQALAMAAGGSVTVLSHPSLQGIASGSGISGSTAWHGAFRFRQYLTGIKPEAGEQPDSDLRQLKFKKNQYGPIGETIILRYRAGLFLAVPATPSLEAAAADQAADDLFLKLLARFADQGRNLSHSTHSSNYAPRIFADEPEAKNLLRAKLALEQAMKRLFRAQKIHVETYGRHCYERLARGKKP